MRLAAACIASALALVALAGCAGGPDAELPGVRTTSTVQDRFTCGPLLMAAGGCVLVGIEAVDSGCSPEVPGYALCDATVWWNATAGSATPGARLATWLNGTQGPTCEPPVGGTCQVRGNVTLRHAFGGPGEQAEWALRLSARLDGAPPAADGDFELDVRFLVRTEPASSADA